MLLKFCSAIALLIKKGYTPVSDLNYCTEEGANYYIGYNGNAAAVAAEIEDESNYLLTKAALREMAATAKIKGVEVVSLFTNYGVELHSKYENPEIVGFDHIHKTQF